jgi:predicted lysophospholipase L1 biosynthesis ABC-type transport system permease subunit
MWAGTVIFIAFFLDPAVKSSGPDGTRFMQQLVKTNRFPIVIMLFAIITVLAGSLLIWKVSGGLQSIWLSTKNGQVLTTGGILAIIAFLIGMTVNRPATVKIAKIGKAVATAGGPPTPAQLAELGMLRKRLSSASKIVAFLLIFVIVGMSIFRYV